VRQIADDEQVLVTRNAEVGTHLYAAEAVQLSAGALRQAPARRWQQQGKCAETRELLTSVYGWFTEGFDTADLQEAKVLLDELQ
jgi:predicted ATPase